MHFSSMEYMEPNSMVEYDTSFEMAHYGKGNIKVVLFTTKEGLMLKCYWLEEIGSWQGLTCGGFKDECIRYISKNFKEYPFGLLKEKQTSIAPIVKK